MNTFYTTVCLVSCLCTNSAILCSSNEAKAETVQKVSIMERFTPEQEAEVKKAIWPELREAKPTGIRRAKAGESITYSFELQNGDSISAMSKNGGNTWVTTYKGTTITAFNVLNSRLIGNKLQGIKEPKAE